MADDGPPRTVERVQLGVRMEAPMVKVLKGLAEFEGVTLGELLERIVLHAFEPVAGEGGEPATSPFSREAVAAVDGLAVVYGMDLDRGARHRGARRTRR